MDTSLPKGFDMLEPLVANWSLPTQNRRQHKRNSSSRGELRYFYDNVLAHLPRILTHVDTFPLNEMPPASRRLFDLAQSLAEVAPHIELYGGDPLVPHSFREARFVAEHGDDE